MSKTTRDDGWKTDDRCMPGASITEGDDLFIVLRVEEIEESPLNPEGMRFWVESASKYVDDLELPGERIYRRTALTYADLRDHYRLVAPAPEAAPEERKAAA